LYFSELPIISYDFSKIKTIFKSFLKFLLKQKRIFIKIGADISMTSAVSGDGPLMGRMCHWAESDPVGSAQLI
jgi:hypothetical protein